ncbi:MAG TPA: tetratricopeptide repeat protein, partial [Burkholderiales bacterium]
MRRILALILLSLVLASCAHEEFRQARIEVEAGHEEEGLARLEQQIKENPGDVELRNYYGRHKSVAVQRYIALGDNARAAGAFDRAEQSYKRALRFDPENAMARAGIEAIQRDQQHRRILVEADQAYKAGQAADAQAKVKQVLAENPQNKEARALLRRIEQKQVKDSATPQLSAAIKKPITMEFRDAPLRTVFE